ALGMAARDLLGERPAERDAEQVGPLVAQHVEQVADDPRVAVHPHRAAGTVRLAGAGRVEPDEAAAGQRALERAPHVEMRADAADQQQRRVALTAAGPLRDADVEVADADLVRRPRERLLRCVVRAVWHGPPPSLCPRPAAGGATGYGHSQPEAPTAVAP